MLRNKPPWRGAAWPPLGLKGGGGREGDLASNNNQAILEQRNTEKRIIREE